MDQEKLKSNAAKLGVSVETYLTLRKSNRKMRYQFVDRKAGRIIVTDDTVAFIPGREDSFDRLQRIGVEFADDSKSIEEILIDRENKERLQIALSELSKEERQIIDALYFWHDGDGQSGRAAAKSLGLPQKTFNDRKLRILEKLRKSLE